MPARGAQARMKLVGGGERLDSGKGRAGGPRRWLPLAVALLLSAAATPGHTAPSRQGAPAASAEPSQAAHIVALARDAMAEYDLKAVIVRVTIDGREVVTTALGESLTGVPATTDMHFHNGSVVFSYMTMLLLVWVDQGVVRLDDPLANWLPELPDAERVTLRMLTNMTAGYQDYVANHQLIEAFYADPFRQWTPQELIAIGLAAPRVFEPGTNWAYSHTNWVILGLALEKIGGKPLASLLQEFVLAPLGLNNTASWPTAVVPEPALHTFSSGAASSSASPAVPASMKNLRIGTPRGLPLRA
jgi:CubicO group peptidase (beta-lactamase class C family)